MAYQPQTLAVTFTDGIDLKADDKLTTKLTELQNGEFEKVGAIQKRHGYSKVQRDLLGSGTAIGDAFGCYARGDEALIGAGARLYSESRAGLVDKGALHPVEIEHFTHPANTSLFDIYQTSGWGRASIYCEGYLYIAHYGARISCYDVAKGCWVDLARSLGYQVDDFVIVKGKVLACGILSGGTPAAGFCWVDPKADPVTWSSFVTVYNTGVYADIPLAAKPYVSGAVACMVFNTTVDGTAGGFGRLTFCDFNLSGIVSTSVTISNGITTGALGGWPTEAVTLLISDNRIRGRGRHRCNQCICRLYSFGCPYCKMQGYRLR
jgi:hypothetical protein